VSGKVVVRDDAVADMEGQAAYLNQGGRTVGDRFLVSARRVFEQIAAMPATGELIASRNPRLAGLRCMMVPKFKNHVIFYLPTVDGIEVLRLLHGARNVQGILDDEGRDEP
jgi:toxin ParE1/3/4